MAKGKAQVKYLGSEGLIQSSDAPDYDFLYEASAVKSPTFNVGDRVVLADGRVFRYAKCGFTAIDSNNFGVKNATCLVACKTAGGDNNAVTLPSVAVGEKKLTVTFTAATLGNSTSRTPAERTGVVAKDELRGGYISFYTGNYRQQRGIIGNSAVAVTDTSMTIYLDAALDYVLTAGTSTCEILANPYGCVAKSNSLHNSVMGMPNVTAALNEYLWLQTWGPLRISGTGNYGTGLRRRQYVFDTQGAVVPINTGITGNAAADTDYNYQMAGFVIETTYELAGCAAPFIMLQINP